MSAHASTVRAARKFVAGPPRGLNEAKFTTIDRKSCTFAWTKRNQIDITLQDRTSSVTFPLNLRRNAGAFTSCYADGGMCALQSEQEPEKELRVGSDKGVLYFALKGKSGSITTGLGPAEAAIASTLIRHAERRRIAALN